MGVKFIEPPLTVVHKYLFGNVSVYQGLGSPRESKIICYAPVYFLV